MQIFKELMDKPIVRILGGFIIFFITWITIDISGFVMNISTLFNFEGDTERYYIAIDFLFKFSISFLLVIIYLIALISILVFEDKKKKYTYDEAIMILQKKKIEIESLILFGYSLSFARKIREYLFLNSTGNEHVTIIVPQLKIIEKKLIDSQPTNSRIESLNGRLHEWNTLKSENRIRKLNVCYTADIPLEYGFLVNDELLFISYYKWNYDEEMDSFKLESQFLNERGFLIVEKQKEERLFNYLWYRIHIKGHNNILDSLINTQEIETGDCNDSI